LDSVGSGRDLLMVSHEQVNESSGRVNGGNFLDQLSDCQFSEKPLLFRVKKVKSMLIPNGRTEVFFAAITTCRG
jgi:hypothetical protein